MLLQLNVSRLGQRCSVALEYFLSSLLDPFLVCLHLAFNVADGSEERFVLRSFLLALLFEVVEQLVHLLEAVLSGIVDFELLVHLVGHLEVDVHGLVVDLLLQLFNVLGQLRVLHVQSVDLGVSLDEQVVSGVELNLLSLDELLQGLELLLANLLLSVLLHWLLDLANPSVRVEVLRLQGDERAVWILDQRLPHRHLVRVE